MKSFAEILMQHPKQSVAKDELLQAFLLSHQSSIAKDVSSFKRQLVVFFFFSDGDIQVLYAPFKFALVGKFSRG